MTEDLPGSYMRMDSKKFEIHGMEFIKESMKSNAADNHAGFDCLIIL
jgi:hypothetical protein